MDPTGVKGLRSVCLPVALFGTSPAWLGGPQLYYGGSDIYLGHPCKENASMFERGCRVVEVSKESLSLMEVSLFGPRD